MRNHQTPDLGPTIGETLTFENARKKKKMMMDRERAKATKEEVKDWDASHVEIDTDKGVIKSINKVLLQDLKINHLKQICRNLRIQMGRKGSDRSSLEAKIYKYIAAGGQIEKVANRNSKKRQKDGKQARKPSTVKEPDTSYRIIHTTLCDDDHYSNIAYATRTSTGSIDGGNVLLLGRDSVTEIQTSDDGKYDGNSASRAEMKRKNRNKEAQWKNKKAKYVKVLKLQDEIVLAEADNPRAISKKKEAISKFSNAQHRQLLRQQIIEYIERLDSPNLSARMRQTVESFLDSTKKALEKLDLPE